VSKWGRAVLIQSPLQHCPQIGGEPGKLRKGARGEIGPICQDMNGLESWRERCRLPARWSLVHGPGYDLDQRRRQTGVVTTSTEPVAAVARSHSVKPQVLSISEKRDLAEFGLVDHMYMCTRAGAHLRIYSPASISHYFSIIFCGFALQSLCGFAL
jgi:hypothetical protein